MAGYFWIKLYHEILDDPKMGRLDDHLWRRVIEFFLIAGDANNGGLLPSVEDMSWRLRTNAEELVKDLIAIEQAGIVKNTKSGWLVVNFERRQGPISSTERVTAYRERKRKDNTSRNDYETDRNTDKIRLEKEIKIETKQNEKETSRYTTQGEKPINEKQHPSGVSNQPDNGGITEEERRLSLIWKQIVDEVRGQNGGKALADNWLKDCELKGLRGDIFIVETRSSYATKYLVDHALQNINTFLPGKFNRPAARVQFVTGGPEV